MEAIQGKWHTPRLGSLLVKRDVVLAAGGARFKLVAAGEGRVRLHSKVQSWLAEPIRHLGPGSSQEELHWKPDDASRATVVWTREFTTVQGRWEASVWGALTVTGAAVQYDSIASPFRLFYDGGRLALLDWRADFLDSGDVRWTRPSQREGPVVIWRPLQEASRARVRRSGLRCSQRTPLQRSIAQVRNLLVQGSGRGLAKVMRAPLSRRPGLCIKERASLTKQGPCAKLRSSPMRAPAPLSSEEKKELQMQLDRLDDGAFEDILKFLRPELGSPHGDEIRLNIDTLSPQRQRAMAARVQKSLRRQLRAATGVQEAKSSSAAAADKGSTT